jgi:hypothetical protein
MYKCYLFTAMAVITYLVGCATGQLQGMGIGMLLASAFIFTAMLIGD